MQKAECLKRMKAPADMRGEACWGVMQICVTTRCDLGACSNCTQLLPYRETWDMTLDNARRAIDSVAEYPGVVGIFGGNPCLHPDFAEISRHLATVIPEPERRGLWSNRLHSHGRIARRVYGYWNLNVHGNNDWAAEMHDALRGVQPPVKIWGEPTADDNGTSAHGAVLVALDDVVSSKTERWGLIAECDVNQRWSPAITQVDGELRAFFCEVAAAFAGMRGDGLTTGVPVEQGWWRKEMPEFAAQVDAYCHKCGVPLRVAGRPDADHVDDVSESYVDAAQAAGRAHEIVGEEWDVAGELTDYLRLRRDEA